MKTRHIILLILSLILLCSCVKEEKRDIRYNLEITVPNEDSDLIEEGMSFSVTGTITSDEEVPDDAIMDIDLIDSNGNIIRHVSQSKKNYDRFDLYNSQMVYYPEDIDPGRKELREFGFVELLVKDEENPEESIHDATIKCLYTDDSFKCFFVYATDVKHGALFDDGMNFTDEKGNPYSAWDLGEYTIRATLKDKDKTIIGECEKKITVGHIDDVIVARFSPPSQKKRAMAFAKEKDLKSLIATLPGYLMPMNGHGYMYDMGLSKMDRASDLSFYSHAHMHMLIYNTTFESNSYTLEHAYGQYQGIIDNPNRFTAYHYDIGEPIMFGESDKEVEGNVVSMSDVFDICRVDIVDSEAEDNVFYTDCHNILSYNLYDGSEIHINHGDRFALMGVMKPFQLDSEDIAFNSDTNLFSLKNSARKLVYDFNGKTYTKDINLKRYTSKLLGDSCLEYYHVFDSKELEKGTTYNVKITVLDAYDKEIGSKNINVSID